MSARCPVCPKAEMACIGAAGDDAEIGARLLEADHGGIPPTARHRGAARARANGGKASGGRVLNAKALSRDWLTVATVATH